MTLVPGVPTVHPRSSWEDPRYPVFGPVDNPADNDTVSIHYTAADNLIDGDPGEHAEDLPQYMRNMQYGYLVSRGYSVGYQFAVDWLGGVWQLRGWEYQSAANKAHNGHTNPVLCLVDGADPVTDEAAHSIRCIVAEAARRSGRAMKIKGHHQLWVESGLGTRTGCPGVGIQAQIDAGVFVPRPIPQPFGDDDMLFIARNSANGAIHLSNGVLRRYAPDAEGIVKASAAAGQPVRDLATGKPVHTLGDVTGVPGKVIAASGLAIDEATKD